MTDGIRTALCTTCMHRDICKYKKEYLKAAAAIQEASIPVIVDGKNGMKYIRSIEFISIRDPDCKHYRKEVGESGRVL